MTTTPTTTTTTMTTTTINGCKENFEDNLGKSIKRDLWNIKSIKSWYEKFQETDDIGRVVRRKESREKVVIACITVALSTLSWTRSNCPRESRGDVHRGENKQAMPPQNRPEEFYRSYGRRERRHDPPDLPNMTLAALKIYMEASTYPDTMSPFPTIDWVFHVPKFNSRVFENGIFVGV
ncbi:hypothetical protein HZH66_004542 [Vespula vulgaris]|uniref:Uncharacterized protein n=1 Tax=Vespula vulgaris TaxID=7454 RepID=A0A834NAY0_VESVU|nr:hypothetical protein HZH66_004542 [Vespula vulgaris]